MVPNLPLVESPNLWLLLGSITAVAAALGAWVARLEGTYAAARPVVPNGKELEAAPDLLPAATA